MSRNNGSACRAVGGSGDNCQDRKNCIRWLNRVGVMSLELPVNLPTETQPQRSSRGFTSLRHTMRGVQASHTSAWGLRDLLHTQLVVRDSVLLFLLVRPRPQSLIGGSVSEYSVGGAAPLTPTVSHVHKLDALVPPLHRRNLTALKWHTLFPTLHVKTSWYRTGGRASLQHNDRVMLQRCSDPHDVGAMLTSFLTCWVVKRAPSPPVP